MSSTCSSASGDDDVDARVRDRVRHLFGAQQDNAFELQLGQRELGASQHEVNLEPAPGHEAQRRVFVQIARQRHLIAVLVVEAHGESAQQLLGESFHRSRTLLRSGALSADRARLAVDDFLPVGRQLRTARLEYRRI
jgi:hypothetical protein